MRNGCKSRALYAGSLFGNAVNPSMGAPAAPSMARTVPNREPAQSAHDLDACGLKACACSV